MTRAALAADGFPSHSRYFHSNAKQQTLHPGATQHHEVRLPVAGVGISRQHQRETSTTLTRHLLYRQQNIKTAMHFSFCLLPLLTTPEQAFLCLRNHESESEKVVHDPAVTVVRYMYTHLCDYGVWGGDFNVDTMFHFSTRVLIGQKKTEQKNSSNSSCQSGFHWNGFSSQQKWGMQILLFIFILDFVTREGSVILLQGNYQEKKVFLRRINGNKHPSPNQSLISKEKGEIASHTFGSHVVCLQFLWSNPPTKTHVGIRELFYTIAAYVNSRGFWATCQDPCILRRKRVRLLKSEVGMCLWAKFVFSVSHCMQIRQLQDRTQIAFSTRSCNGTRDLTKQSDTWLKIKIECVAWIVQNKGIVKH